jgi:putative intracellular protease/amidase
VLPAGRLSASGIVKRRSINVCCVAMKRTNSQPVWITWRAAIQARKAESEATMSRPTIADAAYSHVNVKLLEDALKSLVVAMLLVSAYAVAAPAEERLSLPVSGPVRVAVVVSEGTTLIDIAGPMQVFDQIQAPAGAPKFQTFTVSETRKPIKAGTMTVVPDYTFTDAPEADIVVEGAQSGDSAPYLEYLRRMSRQGRLMLSVCTGVSKFAQAGILDGLTATTHHDFIEAFRERFPHVRFVADRAWIHSAPTIYTAGGETSGIELALHIVELYFDHDVAIKTARYMEYRGPNWQK